MLELKLCNNKIKESKTRKFKKGKWNVIIKAMKRKWMCGVYNCGDSLRFFHVYLEFVQVIIQSISD